MDSLSHWGSSQQLDQTLYYGMRPHVTISGVKSLKNHSSFLVNNRACFFQKTVKGYRIALLDSLTLRIERLMARSH